MEAKQARLESLKNDPSKSAELEKEQKELNALKKELDKLEKDRKDFDGLPKAEAERGA